MDIRASEPGPSRLAVETSLPHERNLDVIPQASAGGAKAAGKKRGEREINCGPRLY